MGGDGGLRRRIVTLAQALVLFLAYVGIINDLNLRTNITINRVTRYSALRIPLPFYREMLVVLAIVLLISYIRRRRMAAALATHAVAILLSYVCGIRLAIPALSVTLLAVTLVSEKERVRERISEILEALATVLMVICSYSAARYIVFFLAPNKPFTEPSWAVAEVHHMLVHSLQLIMMVTYTAIPVIPIIKWVMRRRFRRYVKEVELKEIFSRRTAYAVLWLSALIAVLQNTLPYLPTVNPRMVPIGVDIRYYEAWVREALENGVMEVFHQSEGDRPLYLLILYAVQRTLNLPLRQTVELMPTILLPLLVASTFYMTLRVTRSYSCAALASLFTATGVQTTVGLYASFQANIAALSLMYFSMGLMHSNIGLKKLVPALLSIYLAAELLHPSVIHVLVVLLLDALVNGKVRDKRCIVMVASAISGTLIADVVKYIGSCQTEGTAVSLCQRTFTALIYQSVNNLRCYWTTSYRLVSLYYGGFMTWPLLLLVVLSCFYNNDSVDSFTAPWAIGLLAIYISDWGLYSRLLFNTPLTMLLASIILAVSEDNKLWLMLAISASLGYASLCTFNLIYPTYQ